MFSMELTGKLFEGKDYPTQWALNPSTYQNMSNDQVDWAALAQQWIKMKETVVPPAPPPPSIDTGQSDNDGGGEAPMDMDTKDDDIPPAPPAPSISGSDYYIMMRGNDTPKEKTIFHKKSHKNNSDGWNQWNQWGHWNAAGPGPGNWEWSGVPPPGVTIGPDGKPTGLGNSPVAPSAPQISGNFNVPPPSAPSPYVYNSVSNAQPYNQQVPPYWSGDQSGVMSSQPPPFLKGMRHSNRMPPIRGVDPMRSREEREPTPEEDPYTLDAAKRRQLPAWIREGLEKMEREKQKAVERERQEELRKQEMEARKKAEDEARAVLNPSKSKFDSDSEKETEEETGSRHDETERNVDRSPDHSRPRRSRFRDAESPDSRSAKEGSPIATFAPSLPKRSREEILQDVMLKVRRSLTEILLEVTNEEISSVCREVWSRARAKGEPPVASFNNTAPLAQITRKLGLGIYGDSNSESEEEKREDEEPEEEDSDEELKETLRRRQQAFKKTEEEIEARLAEEEQELKRQEEDHIYEQQKNHIGNSSGRDSVENETINNEREESETMSSGGQTPQHQLITSDTAKINSPMKSAQSESSSNDDDSSSESSTKIKRSSRKDNNSSRGDERKKKSKSRSKSRSRRRSRSRSSDHYRRRKSRSRSIKSRKGYRSRSSSSYRSGRKHRSRSRNRKRERSRSKSRYRSRSHSFGRRYSRSQSRGKRRSRSHSRSRRSPSYSSRRSNSRSRERRRSRSRSRDRRRSRTRSKERRRSPYSSSRNKRRSRSRSRDRRRSRSKSRHTGHHRDGKKSSHRYKD
ncbi:arginine/serine-rich protein PNISR-like isoform X4 [Leptopilina heterotoma]|uniref:arginine/serine-rich protein PNISR-like isoform X4 n=1 Tax=Leptopilina heterotoma TaxID=63436 RepID=UPI001CA9F7F1|nr:arginine/serine-rich protein PNISR-like isoform X4 [Leptopilina heterotoma]